MVTHGPHPKKLQIEIGNLFPETLMIRVYLISATIMQLKFFAYAEARFPSRIKLKLLTK